MKKNSSLFIVMLYSLTLGFTPFFTMAQTNVSSVKDINFPVSATAPTQWQISTTKHYPMEPNNLSCHTIDMTNGNGHELQVWSYDNKNGATNTFFHAGFAWREFDGTNYINYGSITEPNSSNVSSLSGGTSPIDIDVACYYDPSSPWLDINNNQRVGGYMTVLVYNLPGHGCYYEILVYDDVNLMMAQVLAPQALPMSQPLSNTAINVDAINTANGSYVVITYDDFGKIMAVPLNTNNSSTGLGTPLAIISGGLIKPDVALNDDGNGAITACYTFADNTKIIHVVAQAYNFPSLTTPLTMVFASPTAISSVGNTSEPRIDCPDFGNPRTWAVTIDENSNISPSYIWLYEQYLGGTSLANIINTSAIFTSLLDIHKQGNVYPVVAYDATSGNVTVAWDYNTTSSGIAITSYAIAAPTNFFISEFIDVTGASLNLINVSSQYNDVAYQYNSNDNTNGLCAMALSGNNQRQFSSVQNAQFEAFTSDQITNPVWRYSIWVKDDIYNNGSSGDGGRIKKTEVPNPLQQKLELNITPNPFNENIQLRSNNPTAIFHLIFTDVSGRELLNTNDEMNSLNTQLNAITSKLPVGIYFVKISSNGSTVLNQKIVKM